MASGLEQKPGEGPRHEHGPNLRLRGSQSPYLLEVVSVQGILQALTLLGASDATQGMLGHKSRTPVRRWGDSLTNRG